MESHIRLQSKKTATSSWTNSSLTSANIPTLANPVRGFGLQADVVQKSSNLQAKQADGKQLSQEEAFQQKPLSHDISRISLRSQAKFKVPSGELYQQADGVAQKVMRQENTTGMPDHLKAGMENLQTVSNSQQMITQCKLQPTIGQTIGLDVIQRYEDEYHEETATSIKSDSANYLLAESNNFVYARQGTPAPAYSNLGNMIAVDGLGNYQRYTPSDKFLADCLHTAEEIMHGQRLRRGKVRSQVSQTGTVFGESEEDNWDAANEVSEDQRNTNAIPGVGDAYAIVAQQPIDIGEETDPIDCQYHAAAVVAEDGSDRITLEVFGNPDKKGRNTKGTYSIYDTDPESGNTFHEAWTGTFGQAAVTISLERIPEDMEE
ncbi:MAG: hypothetical protein RM347_035000 [Nostoc sp. ChiQUE02]|uniref:hypothetical protein n=1 Tax=Nostoc sp. ChiQUE02 TaxID=3075377 RepID=UPI002AD38F03|nr:hypothetical protein [Nostoc sp. ChiQUE02]MDZ8232492.1 hypothetical protein [Nostoc sp. ChiQUE02]